MVDRNHPIAVYVSDADRVVLQAKAMAAGLRVSSYLRACGLGRESRSKADHEAITALARINGEMIEAAQMFREVAHVAPDRVAIVLDRIDALQERIASLAATL